MFASIPILNLSTTCHCQNAEGPEFPGPSLAIFISTVAPAAPMGQLEPPAAPVARLLAVD